MQVTNFRLMIITPTLGSSAFLEQAFESCCYAGDLRKHIISAPAQRVKELQERFPTAQVIADAGSDFGMYGAINAGIDMALKNDEWDWFTYLNDDDVLFPGFSELATSALSSTSDVLYGAVDMIDKEGRPLYTLPVANSGRNVEAVWRCRKSPFTQQGAIVARRVLTDGHRFDSTLRYAGDMEFWIRLSRGGYTFQYVPSRVAGFRVMPGQLSADQREFQAEKERIYRRHFPEGTYQGVRRAVITSYFAATNLRSYGQRFHRMKIRRAQSYFQKADRL